MVTENQGESNAGSSDAPASSGGGESSGAESTGSGNSAQLSEHAERAASQNPEKMEGEAQEGQAQKAVTPPYKPNFKFKVLDKETRQQKEKEFDPWLHAAIKDPEIEKQVRDLYEKAHGIEYVKESRQQLEDHLNQLAPIAHQDRQIIETVQGYIANKDMDSLQKSLTITDDDILKQALKIIKIREMSPEQQQAYYASQQASERAQMLEYQNQNLQTQNMQVGVQMRTQELGWTLQRPDIAQFANAYDARTGVPGSFKNAMIERGKYHAVVNKVDLSPEQVAMDVVKFLGGPAALIPPAQPQIVPQTSDSQPKPVMTNIQGKGTSPTKKVFKNLKDVKKYAKERAMASNQ